MTNHHANENYTSKTIDPYSMPDTAEYHRRKAEQAIEQAWNTTISTKDKLVSDPESGAMKADGNKLRYDLLPARPLEDLVNILTFGAQKYADRNWEGGMAWSRPFAACMRHLWAWWRGEDADPDSGLSHLAHAACNIFFLMEFEYTRKDYDDRPYTSK